MSHIYLIRHGQASFDADDYDQLSPLGEEQSRLLGSWLRQTRQNMHHIIIGGNQRHRQTAEHCLQQFDDEQTNTTPKIKHEIAQQNWQLDPGFNEFQHEEVLLKYCTEFANFKALKQSLANHPHPRQAFHAMFTAAIQRWTSGEFDDYSESWLAFQQRCRLALKRVLAMNDASEVDKNICIFTSGGTISVLLQEILGINDQRIFDLNACLINTGITKLRAGSKQLSLNYLNSSAHLDLDPRSELISYR